MSRERFAFLAGNSNSKEVAPNPRYSRRAHFSNFLKTREPATVFNRVSQVSFFPPRFLNFSPFQRLFFESCLKPGNQRTSFIAFRKFSFFPPLDRFLNFFPFPTFRPFFRELPETRETATVDYSFLLISSINRAGEILSLFSKKIFRIGNFMTFPVPRNSRRANKNRQKANKILSERDFPLFSTETTTATLFFIPESLLMTVVRWKFAIKPNRPCSQDDLGPAKRKKRETRTQHTQLCDFHWGGGQFSSVRSGPNERKEREWSLFVFFVITYVCPHSQMRWVANGNDNNNG